MDFPSGPWTGFYNYGKSAPKHRMDLVLIFGGRTISGDGNDDIGRFFVTGHFDQTNGECSWTKTYIGGHEVFYPGVRESKSIWGVWGLPSESSRLPIRPRGHQQGGQQYGTPGEPPPSDGSAAHTPA